MSTALACRAGPEADVKAVRVHQFGGPEVLSLEDIPDPQPGPGQVVVRISAIGVNPVDTYIRSGKYGPRPFPYTPGADAAGVVAAVGDNVTRVKTGDRVYTGSTISGAYAQMALCSEQTVYPLPPHITFSQGAAIGIPYGTAHRALFHRAQVRAGERVLVHGASGGVGLAAIQLARAFGCTVIGTAGTQEGRTLVANEGAHFVLDHRSDGYLTKLMDFTDGKGVELILEMAAHINLGKDLEILAKYGRVIVIGNRGRVEIDARETMRRDADIRGMTLMNATETDLLGVHAAIIAGLENGSLRPIVARELPLSEVARAQELVMQDGARGKIVLVP
jgi:NADPH2:quinone reductase